MSNTMSDHNCWLEQQLAPASPPDTIVHLGAGLCRELDAWRASGAQRIVLVEPNPELLPELNQRIRTSDPIDILPVAISAQAGREALRLFNFAMLSSLRTPTGLYPILPGLSQIGRAMVEIVTVEQLLDDLDLNPEGDHWLVIDTPGEEAAIVQQLETIERLHQFSRIFLTAGAEELYQGAETAQAIGQRLQAAGYNPAGRPDDSDGDWPRCHLVLNRMALECRELQNELQALKAQLAEAEQTRDQAQQQAQSQAEQSQALAAELQSAREQADQHRSRIQELESALSEQGGKAEQLTFECEQLRHKLAEAERNRDQAQQVAQSQSEQSQTLAAELQSAREEADQDRSCIQELERTLSEQAGKAEQHASQIESLSSQLKTAQEQTTKHQAQFEKAQADLSLALRLQMLRENDLKELQSRYGEVLTIKDEQQDLLTQLHHRLSRAAEYLQLVHAQSDDQRLPDELLEALTGKGDQTV